MHDNQAPRRPPSSFELLLFMVCLIAPFIIAIIEAERRISEQPGLSTSSPITATCTTDDECGCTLDCLDTVDGPEQGSALKVPLQGLSSSR